jgi:hypothetical protein
MRAIVVLLVALSVSPQALAERVCMPLDDVPLITALQRDRAARVEKLRISGLVLTITGLTGMVALGLYGAYLDGTARQRQDDSGFALWGTAMNVNLVGAVLVGVGAPLLAVGTEMQKEDARGAPVVLEIRY